MKAMKSMFFVGLLAFGVSVETPGRAFYTLTWGYSEENVANIPDVVKTNATDIAAGYWHNLSIVNGNVEAWGTASNGVTSVPLLARQGTVTKIAAGDTASACVANGNIVVWGGDTAYLVGPSSTEVYQDVAVGISAERSGLIGEFTFGLGLTEEARVEFWGTSFAGAQAIQDWRNISAVSAGRSFAMGLCNGEVLVAGAPYLSSPTNTYGVENVPEEAKSGVTAIAAGPFHCMALKDTGEVLVWGAHAGTSNTALGNVTNVPAEAKSNVMGIAAGYNVCAALLKNGQVVIWGSEQGTGALVKDVPKYATRSVKKVVLGKQYAVVQSTFLPPEFTTESLPTGYLETDYKASITTLAYPSATLTFQNTNLCPPGLKMSTNGVITGVPTRLGTNLFTVVASNDYDVVSKQFSIFVTNRETRPPEFVTKTLPVAQIGFPYEVQIEATEEPTFSVDESTGYLMPPGLTLSADGWITGWATTTGDYYPTIVITNKAGGMSKQFTIKVTEATDKPVIGTTSPLPDGLKYGNTYYSNSLSVTGATNVFISSGANAISGLGIVGSDPTWALAGTPTVHGDNLTFTLTAQNAAGSVTSNFTITIHGPPVWQTPTGALPTACLGKPYETVVWAKWGDAYKKQSGSLPPGLTMSTRVRDDGWTECVISGTPTAAGENRVQLRAQNAYDPTTLWTLRTFTLTVEVEKADQTISFAAIGAQMTTNRVELSATATSGGVVTFEVMSGPGRIDGDVLSFTGVGIVELQAVQAGNDLWLPVTAKQTVTVEKANQTISFAAIGTQTTTNRVKLSATATSGGVVTFEVMSGPGRIDGDVLSFTGVGIVELQAVQAGNDLWLPATAKQTVTVEKANQTISFANIGAQTTTNRVELSAAATSGGVVTFEVLSGPGRIEGSVLSFTGGGIVEVQAVQAGNDLWLPVTAKQTVTVERANQTISFAAIGAQTTTNRVELSAAATSGGVVTFEVVSGPGCIDGNVLSFTRAGTVEVRAVQTGNDTWLPVSATQSVLVEKADQTIVFPPIGMQSSAGRVVLSAMATGGGVVTFEVLSGPGRIDGNVLSFTGGGIVVVQAAQAGDECWLPVSATQTVQVKVPQTISFASIGPQFATNRVELSATASSGGAVTFKVVSGPGYIEGNVLSFTGSGRVEIQAVQGGSDLWLPATATQIVTVLFESEPSPITFLETRGVGDGETLLVGDGATLRYDTAWAGEGASGVTVSETRPGGSPATLLSLASEVAGELDWAPGVPGLYTLTCQAGTAEALTARIQVLRAGTTVHQTETVLGSVNWGAGSVHVVHGTVTVASGAKLTIASGAVVKFTEGSALVVASGGQCIVKGVIFTPIADDTVGGDTMADGDASRPAADTYAITGNVTGDEWTEKRWLTDAGLSWIFTVVNGGAVIGQPAIPTTTTGAVLLPATLDGYPVTGIGEGAFSGCGKLTWVGIQDGVEFIGDEAFDECERLESMVLPATLNDWGMRSLPPAMQERLEYGADGFMVLNGWVLGYCDNGASSLTLPAGVVGIGSHALADYWDLQTVRMPDTLRYIGRGAFETNTYLDNVVIPDGVEIVRDGAFQGGTFMRDLTIGESVGQIGREAFARCSQLATVTVPESVTVIGDGAFSNCWRMLSVRLPLGLQSAGNGIFAACKALTGVTMPAHKFTAARLFEERYAALESVTVAEGETAILANAFAGCSALANVSLPASLGSIGYEAFADCTSLAGIDLPRSLTQIGSRAFSGCSALEAIALPDSVTGLGTEAFRDCWALENASLSRSLAVIPDYVFQGCSKLTSLVVPASVTTLGKGIGNYLQAVYCLGNAPAYDAATYSPRAADVTTYVVRGTRGWDGIPSSRDLPESWIGWPITFWEPNRFSATFDANGGTFPGGATTYACEQITGVAYALPPYEPSWEGTEFDGWWTDPSGGAQIKATTRVNETRDITFYAHWKGVPVAVTVRFNANGGTVTPSEGAYWAGRTYGELPVATREYHRFAGWWTAAEGGELVTAASRVPSANQELFAHWTPETYAIRFHASGGEGTMEDQSFTYGGAVTLRTNAFWREGCEFAGWATSAEGEAVYADGARFASVSAIQDGVIHLYAVWSDGGYAVRFDANGGTGRMENQTFLFGVAQALSPNQFSRGRFRFLGWTLAPLGGVVYADGAVVRDLTVTPGGTVVLYAVWEFPTIPEDAGVAEVLKDSSDRRLKEKVTTADVYAGFREWALGVKGSDGGVASANAVLASEYAWGSYLLGAEALFTNEPSIKLEEMAVETGGDGKRDAPGMILKVSVTVRDGEQVVNVDASKVAALFECTSDLADWTGEAALKPTVAEKGSEGEAMCFEVTPAGPGARAFLRIAE